MVAHCGPVWTSPMTLFSSKVVAFVAAVMNVERLYDMKLRLVQQARVSIQKGYTTKVGLHIFRKGMDCRLVGRTAHDCAYELLTECLWFFAARRTRATKKAAREILHHILHSAPYFVILSPPRFRGHTESASGASRWTWRASQPRGGCMGQVAIKNALLVTVPSVPSAMRSRPRASPQHTSPAQTITAPWTSASLPVT
ncbi:hypothetical protein EI94DRAFT_1756895 [Lactarius quietus]|nr:hypothetical protein EI94DRAFT_1756895 [Lactarius quietus]